MLKISKSYYIWLIYNELKYIDINNNNLFDQ